MLDKMKYTFDIKRLLSDSNMFVKCKNETEKVKIKIKKLICNYPEFIKLKGILLMWKIIGLPKINKSLKKLPLHSKISIVGTVTNSIAKQMVSVENITPLKISPFNFITFY